MSRILSGFGISADNPADAGRVLLKDFFEKFTELAGEDATALGYLRNVYTIGGAARRAYLKIRYPKGNLKTYQKYHHCDEKFEDYFRIRHLQLSGMCFFPEKRRGELVKKTIYKYDVNGLYSYTANTCGELTYPRRASFNEFVRDRSFDVVYIIVVEGLIAYRKRGMPNAFADPYGGTDADVIHIEGEFAMFRDLWDALHLYYDFEEYKVIDVFKCEKRGDPSMQEYNERFQRMKSAAAERGDALSRSLAKGFLNNLIGKFTQRTKYIEANARYNECTDMVEFVEGDILNNWEKGHFDFIRGAYIYTMARVQVMLDIARVCKGDGGAAAHHFYTDTDSIVTDIPLPSEMVDPYRLGAYKLERKYSAFGVMGKKLYYGRTQDGQDELTAAGIPKGLVVEEIHKLYGDELTPEETWQVLLSGAAYEAYFNSRTKGGGAQLLSPVHVGEVDVDKIFFGGME